MTQEEYDKRLAELEAEADRRGCCIIPATPVPPPDEGLAADAPASATEQRI
jgi:hypothetical protein